MKKRKLFRQGLLHEDTPVLKGKIAKRFAYPPFSILNAREGIWQKRKAAWLGLGIKSELGRFDGLTYGDGDSEEITSPGLNFYPDKNSGKKKPVCGISADGTAATERSNAGTPFTDAAKKRQKVSPGDSPRQAADYGKSGARSDGAGRAIPDSAYTDIGQPVARYRSPKRGVHTFSAACTIKRHGGTIESDGSSVLKSRNKKAFGTTDEQKRYKANSACRPHSGHDPRPGRVAGTEYTGGDAWVSSGEDGTTGTSIFDPVLTELSYKWFCPPGGRILDPFAGGSVRGIVAGYLGYEYLGVELRPEQAAANREQRAEILAGHDVPDPRWQVGDALDIQKICRKREYAADFIFSCPPYGSLEIYSDDPRDLSQMTPEQFLETYQKIIRRSARCLKPDRFACFVVGDYRLKNGHYANFTCQTIDAFAAAGLPLYNSAVLVTAVGSLPIRIGKQFDSGRKLGRTHQDVLIFVKGDWKKATAACGKL